jgi:hypothetical protein
MTGFVACASTRANHSFSFGDGSFRNQAFNYTFGTERIRFSLALRRAGASLLVPPPFE